MGKLGAGGRARWGGYSVRIAYAGVVVVEVFLDGTDGGLGDGGAKERGGGMRRGEVDEGARKGGGG